MAPVRSVPPGWGKRWPEAVGLSVRRLSWTSEETKVVSSQRLRGINVLDPSKNLQPSTDKQAAAVK